MTMMQSSSISSSSSTNNNNNMDSSYQSSIYGLNSFGSASGSSSSSSSSSGSEGITNKQDEFEPFISPLSLAITIGACIMWTLGVWKSRFLGDSSNWVLFGIESVVVFGLCIASAYGLGALLKHLFLPDLMFLVQESASGSSSRRATNDDFW
jgi:hypothetical protein